MDDILSNILAKSSYFRQVKNDDYTFITRYLGLIVNGVAIFNVKWVFISQEELLFFADNNEEKPTASVSLNNLDSLMVVTEEGIKEIL